MKLFNNILCCFFGHKADKHMLAYSIESYLKSYEVKIYDIARCSRCESVYNNSLIDQYQRYVWYTQTAIEHEEKRLQEHNIVSISEAYELLGKKMKNNMIY